MRPQSAKAKGRRFQQHIAQSIRTAFPHLAEDDVVSTSMGAGGEDVRLSPLARESLPLSIEAKNQERLNVWACLEQCQKNSPAGATPCLVFSRNRANTYAVVEWSVLLDLYCRVARAGDTTMPPRLRRLLAELAHYAPTSDHLDEADAEDKAASCHSCRES